MCMGGDDLTEYRPCAPSEPDDAFYDEGAEDDGDEREDPDVWR